MVDRRRNAGCCRYLSDECLRGFGKYKVSVWLLLGRVTLNHRCLWIPARSSFSPPQYRCIDTSPLSVYVMHPFWNYVVEVSAPTSTPFHLRPKCCYPFHEWIENELWAGVKVIVVQEWELLSTIGRRGAIVLTYGGSCALSFECIGECGLSSCKHRHIG